MPAPAQLVIEAAKEIYRQLEEDDKFVGTWLAQFTVYLVLAALVMAGHDSGNIVWYWLVCLLGISVAIDVVRGGTDGMGQRPR